jgi:hypothetical protein
MISLMKKHFLLLVALLSLCLTAGAQQRKLSVYGVGFYNLENLFDTCHDAGKNDYEFLPKGSYRWNGMKYTHKLHNMAQALGDMGTNVLKGVGCAVIGVSEVENDRVLADLCSQPALKARGFKFCHVEGPDRRGVDCGLLYNPQLFTVKDVRLYPYVPTEKEGDNFRTRGFLAVSGELAGEHVAFIVCHLPSRFAGSYYREVGAEQAAAVKNRILAKDKNCKVFVMGDMNDDPTDKSISEKLSGKPEISEVGKDDMYNPWYNILVKKGTGTLQYQGSWNLFDQILLSPGLLNKNDQKDFSSLKYVKREVQRMPYLFQTEGKYKGNMKRTTAGGVWLDGYSDHLPVVVYVAKESGRDDKADFDGKLPELTETEQQFLDKCAEELKGYIAKDKEAK